MKKYVAMCCVFALLAASACTKIAEGNAARSQNRAYEAQGEVAKERLALVGRYQTCVAEAGDDLAEIEACDVYLRSAEALK